MRLLISLLNSGSSLPQLLDLADAVDDRRVVFSTEFLADLGQGGLGQLLGQVHGDLAGEGDLGRVVLGLELGRLDLELVADELLDLFHSDDRRRRIEEALEGLLGQVEVDPLALEGGEGDDPAQVALELADVGLDLVGDVEGDALGQDDGLGLGLLLEDGDPRLDVRRLEVGDQAPLEAGAEALLEVGDLLRAGSRSR